MKVGFNRTAANGAHRYEPGRAYIIDDSVASKYIKRGVAYKWPENLPQDEFKPELAYRKDETGLPHESGHLAFIEKVEVSAVDSEEAPEAEAEEKEEKEAPKTKEEKAAPKRTTKGRGRPRKAQ